MRLMGATVAVSVATVITLPDFSFTIHSVDKRLALYSDPDSILTYAFAPGEAAPGENYDLEAIGHTGNPVGLWTEHDDMRPDGHGHYWPAAASDIGTNTRDLIRKFVGNPISSPLVPVECRSRQLSPKIRLTCTRLSPTASDRELSILSVSFHNRFDRPIIHR